MHTLIPLQSHWVSTQMGGITVGYKSLILSTQVKQGKVHRSDSPNCNPTQNISETLLYFHCSISSEMGGLPVGLEILIPFSFIDHWDGWETENTLKLYCDCKADQENCCFIGQTQSNARAEKQIRWTFDDNFPYFSIKTCCGIH